MNNKNKRFNIYNKLLEYFLVNLRDKPYYVQEKAKLLVIWSIAGVMLLPMMGLVLLIINQIHLVGILVIIVLLVLFLIGPLFLRRGWYQTSANIGIMGTAAAIIIFSYKDILLGKYLADFTNNYYMFATICASILLCRTTMTIGLAVIFFIYRVIVYYVLSKSPIEPSIIYLLERSLTDLFFSLVFVIVTSYLINKIFKRSIAESEHEAEKNRDHYNKLKELFLSLEDISSELAILSDELSHGMISIDSNIQTQAASTEQITAALEQIMANAENISQRSEFQNGILKNLINEIESLTSGTLRINNDLQESSEFSSIISSNADLNMISLNKMHEVIERITKSSFDMDNVLGIIDEIFERIHLLSINAAIEAARVGNAGKGFAIVAEEVSKLSDQTANALKNINELIKVNKKEVGEGSRYIMESIDNINEIVEMIKNMDSKISHIHLFMKEQVTVNCKVNDETGRIHQVSEEISTATAEQRIATSESVNSLENIAAMAQKNASVTSHASKSAVRIAEMASIIEQKIGAY